MARQPSATRCKTGDLAHAGRQATLAPRPPRAVGAVVGIVAVLAVAGCARAIPTTQGGPATVTADQSANGTYLVDEGGHALYLFTRDKKGESYCSDACASVWPPYETTGRPTAGKGVSPRMLGTIAREDGGRQITYAGSPLYYYAGDGGKPDKTSGEAIEQFGAEWYLVSAKDGAPAESDSRAGGS